ncbi:MAG: FAD-dependent oxidoreductase, partial [Halobacteria archaeon]|nr:FAD-dependent oxidoreductase [Halobacteria archaeon]
MSVVYDVAVIGGGATGCGVARDLAMRNLSVVLIERGKLCEGTTGHSHCLLHSGARYADSDPAGASECAAENEILKEIGGCCVEETGGYFVQLEGDSAEYFEEKLEKCQELGIETKVLDGDDVREREPQVSSRVEKAIKVPDGVIYPSRLVAANALSAEEHGADIVTGRGVVDIDSTENWNIKLGDGEIRASHVVNATGAWAGEVGAMAGVNIDM